MNDVSAMRRVRIKDVLVEVGPRSKTGKGLPLSMTQDRGLIPTSEANVANPPSTYIGAKKVIPGDLVFNKLKAHLGVFAVSDYSGLVSPDYAVYRLRRDGVDIRYLNYLFHTPEYIDEFILRRSGVADGLKRLYTRELFQISIPLPPKSLQSSIVNFLDAKCAEIDKAIEAAEASIEEYKLYKKSVIFQAVTKGLDPNAPMKDSGIEWIGEIPRSWKTTRIKNLLAEKSVKGRPDETVLSLYREYGIIPKDSRDDNHNVTSSDTSTYKFVEVGDFVINKMKAWQGSMALSGYQGIISPAYLVYRFISDDVDPRYLHHLLRSRPYADEFARLSTGIRIGQWDLHSNDFLCTLALLPPMDEQERIVAYVDEKCGEIDKAIVAKQQIIEELKAYKKSLIWEVVTGKREV